MNFIWNLNNCAPAHREEIRSAYVINGVPLQENHSWLFQARSGYEKLTSCLLIKRSTDLELSNSTCIHWEIYVLVYQCHQSTVIAETFTTYLEGMIPLEDLLFHSLAFSAWREEESLSTGYQLDCLLQCKGLWPYCVQWQIVDLMH